MQAGQLRSSVASVLAFGHMMGLRHSNRHHKPRVTAKHVEIREPSMGATELGITFESDPELYRALHPVFTGREKSIPTVNKDEQSQTEPVQSVQQAPTAQENIQLPSPAKKPASWTWEL